MDRRLADGARSLRRRYPTGAVPIAGHRRRGDLHGHLGPGAVGRQRRRHHRDPVRVGVGGLGPRRDHAPIAHRPTRVLEARRQRRCVRTRRIRVARDGSRSRCDPHDRHRRHRAAGWCNRRDRARRRAAPASRVAPRADRTVAHARTRVVRWLACDPGRVATRQSSPGARDRRHGGVARSGGSSGGRQAPDRPCAHRRQRCRHVPPADLLGSAASTRPPEPVDRSSDGADRRDLHLVRTRCDRAARTARRPVDQRRVDRDHTRGRLVGGVLDRVRNRSAGRRCHRCRR